jgi:hypothetical protein
VRDSVLKLGGSMGQNQYVHVAKRRSIRSNT